MESAPSPPIRCVRCHRGLSPPEQASQTGLCRSCWTTLRTTRPNPPATPDDTAPPSPLIQTCQNCHRTLLEDTGSNVLCSVCWALHHLRCMRCNALISVETTRFSGGLCYECWDDEGDESMGRCFRCHKRLTPDEKEKFSECICYSCRTIYCFLCNAVLNVEEQKGITGWCNSCMEKQVWK